MLRQFLYIIRPIQSTGKKLPFGQSYRELVIPRWIGLCISTYNWITLGSWFTLIIIYIEIVLSVLLNFHPMSIESFLNQTQSFDTLEAFSLPFSLKKRIKYIIIVALNKTILLLRPLVKPSLQQIPRRESKCRMAVTLNITFLILAALVLPSLEQTHITASLEMTASS